MKKILLQLFFCLSLLSANAQYPEIHAIYNLPTPECDSFVTDNRFSDTAAFRIYDLHAFTIVNGKIDEHRVYDDQKRLAEINKVTRNKDGLITLLEKFRYSSLERKTTITYNSQKLPDSLRFQAITDGHVDFEFGESYKYMNGKLDSIIEIGFDTTKNIWIVYSRIKFHYGHDDISAQFTYRRKNNTEWIPEYRTLYFHFSEGILGSKTDYYYNSDKWIPIKREQYTYTSLGEIESRTYASYFDGLWSNNIADTFLNNNEYNTYPIASKTPYINGRKRCYNKKTNSIFSKEIPQGFYVYPNPAQDILNISNLNSMDGQVKIYDVTGRLKMTLSQSFNSPLNISHLEKGIYILEIHHGTPISFMVHFNDGDSWLKARMKRFGCL
ncbi:MAG: T9SS type A sorting domain-containing protein [Flavobacterium sp.]|nr:MAG: T9SS type A sorting domain-containing protein [Flavobacterium sp.]